VLDRQTRIGASATSGQTRTGPGHLAGARAYPKIVFAPPPFGGAAAA